MSTQFAQNTSNWQEKALSLDRGWRLTTAVVSILIGLFVIVRPQSGVVTLSIAFGLYLVFEGVSRFSFAVTGTDRKSSSRWLGAIVGVLVVGAGFYCLLNLDTSLLVLGITLGLGFIGVGVADLSNTGRGQVARPSWVRIFGGILAVISGLIMLIVPFLSVAVVVWCGAFILIALGVIGVVMLPRAANDQSTLEP
jgi:uncharacterized membrane protein HdeD (DUF308 family)